MDNGVSRPLEEKDFGENTLILTMTRAQKDKILSEYKNACNVYSIMEFAGGNGDILTHTAAIMPYTKCFIHRFIPGLIRLK